MRLSEDFLDNIGSTNSRAASDLAGEITGQRPLTTNDRRDILTPEYNLAFTTMIYYKYIKAYGETRQLQEVVGALMTDIANIMRNALSGLANIEYSPVLISDTLDDNDKNWNLESFVLDKHSLISSSLYMTICLSIRPENVRWKQFMKTLMLLMYNIYRFYQEEYKKGRVHDCQFIFNKINNGQIDCCSDNTVQVMSFENKYCTIHWRELLKMCGYSFIDIPMKPLKDYIETIDDKRDKIRYFMFK